MKQRPIVLAYGLRWDRKLWEKVQKYKLPTFNEFPTSGIYVYYWKGQAVYIGIAGKQLDSRIAGSHKLVAGRWDSFSWFIIDQQVFLRDIESFCLRALSPQRMGEMRVRKEYDSASLWMNGDPSGFALERKQYRNYWLDNDGRLTTVREAGRLLLKPEWQVRCRLKHQKN